MKKLLSSALLVLSFSVAIRAQDHGHLNVGAESVTQNAKLTFDNGADFATASSYIKTLTYVDPATSPTNSLFKYRGQYQGNITLTVLAATDQRGGPIPNAPAVGSQIYAQITSVDGPAGGVFNFWDSNAPTATISVPCGSTATNQFILSENFGAADEDPYGHIHGRRFSATKAGVYTVAFRASDRSANGPSGGPIHTPSDILKIYFQAGLNIASVSRTGTTNLVTFGTVLNQTFYVEASDSLTATNWIQIGGGFGGNDLLQSVIDPAATAPSRFYRLRVTTP